LNSGLLFSMEAGSVGKLWNSHMFGIKAKLAVVVSVIEG
jgi:hypothetical protein